MRFAPLVSCLAVALGVSACQQPAATPAPTVNAPAPSAEASVTPPVAAPAAAGKVMALRAFGNEPSWDMTDAGDGTLVFTAMGQKGEERFKAVRSEDASGIHYAGTGVKLDIVPGKCSDGMSDDTHAFSSTLVMKGKTYKGCAAPASAVQVAENENPTVLKGAAAEDGFSVDGYSPAWSAQTNGDSFKLDVPEHNRVDPGFSTLKAKRTNVDAGVDYTGMDGKTAFTLEIRNKDCDVPGRKFSATLKYGKQTYTGCANGL